MKGRDVIPLEWRSLDAWPALPPSRPVEEQLVIRRQQCACGLWVTQHVDEHPTMVEWQHTQTPGHREWRNRLGL